MANTADSAEFRSELQIISKIVGEIIGEDIALTPEDDLRKIGKLDSLQTLIVFMELEKHTGIETPDTETLIKENWYNIGELCRRLAQAQK